MTDDCKTSKKYGSSNKVCAAQNTTIDTLLFLLGNFFGKIFAKVQQRMASRSTEQSEFTNTFSLLVFSAKPEPIYFLLTFLSIV